jgi:hypothetical protein
LIVTIFDLTLHFHSSQQVAADRLVYRDASSQQPLQRHLGVATAGAKRAEELQERVAAAAQAAPRMVDPDRLSLADLVEVDDSDLPYRTKDDPPAGGQGRSHVGGFHPDCIPQEFQKFQGDGETGLTLAARLQGCPAVYQPKATVHHVIPKGRLTPEYFEKRAYYQGVCDSYSDIRREGSAASVDSVKVKFSLLPYVQKTVGRVVGYLKHLRDQARVTAETAEVTAIRQRVHRAYRAGYEFHQSAVRSSPELLAWVLRPDYWDYRLPQLKYPAETKAVGD